MFRKEQWNTSSDVGRLQGERLPDRLLQRLLEHLAMQRLLDLLDVALKCRDVCAEVR